MRCPPGEARRWIVADDEGRGWRWVRMRMIEDAVRSMSASPRLETRIKGDERRE